MACDIIEESKGLYKRFHGFVTAQEFLQAIMALQNHENFSNFRYSLNDFTDVEGHDIGPNRLTEFAAFGLGAAYTNARIKIAIVSTDETICGLVQLYALKIKDTFPLRIFPTIALARRWVEPD